MARIGVISPLIVWSAQCSPRHYEHWQIRAWQGQDKDPLGSGTRAELEQGLGPTYLWSLGNLENVKR